MSDQLPDPRTEPQRHVAPLRRRREFAIAALLTLVTGAVIYTGLGYLLGVIGFLLALVAWLITLGYGASRRTPTGRGVTVGCLLLLLASLVGVLIETMSTP